MGGQREATDKVQIKTDLTLIGPDTLCRRGKVGLHHGGDALTEGLERQQALVGGVELNKNCIWILEITGCGSQLQCLDAVTSPVIY